MDEKELKEILEQHKLWLSSSGNDGKQADFSRADLSEVDLSRADLSKANLSGAILREADLTRAKLTRANLSRVDFREADLSEADLIGASLFKADLSRVDFREADISGVNLSKVDFSKADLRGADLRGADLSEVNLSGANLSGAILSGAILSGAILSGANIEKIKIDLKTKIDLPDELFEKYGATIQVVGVHFNAPNLKKEDHIYAEFDNTSDFDQSAVKSHINYFEDFLYDFYYVRADVDSNTKGNKIIVEITPKEKDTPLDTLEEAFKLFILASSEKIEIIPASHVDLEDQLYDLKEKSVEFKHQSNKWRRRYNKEVKKVEQLEQKVEKQRGYLIKAKNILERHPEFQTLYDRYITIEKRQSHSSQKEVEVSVGPGVSIGVEGLSMGQILKLGKFSFSTSWFTAKVKKSSN